MDKCSATVTDAKVVYSCYSVDSVTATDMRNLNKVKKILNFEFSIYGSGDKVSIVISVKLLFTTVVDWRDVL